MVTPPAAVGVEAEAPVFRQSPEAAAVSVAPRAAEASSPGSLVHTSKPYGGIFSIECPLHIKTASTMSLLSFVYLSQCRKAFLGRVLTSKK